MKSLLKGIRSLIIGLWIVMAIFVTICLLSYNEYNITVINKNSFLIIDNDELEPKFKEGDLVIVKRVSDKKIEIGDTVFFYNGNKSNEFLINLGVVTDKQKVNDKESTYEIEGKTISGEYVIGKADGSKVMHHAGTALGIVQSRWGFMFLVILPALFAMVWEIIIIVDEVKKAGKDEEDEEKTPKKKKEEDDK